MNTKQANKQAKDKQTNKQSGAGKESEQYPVSCWLSCNSLI